MRTYAAVMSTLVDSGDRRNGLDAVAQCAKKGSQSMTHPTPIIDRSQLPTASFPWGVLKWLVTPEITSGAAMTVGEVVLMPGMGHERHNHPDSEEILYFLTGFGEQM